MLWFHNRKFSIISLKKIILLLNCSCFAKNDFLKEPPLTILSTYTQIKTWRFLVLLKSRPKIVLPCLSQNYRRNQSVQDWAKSRKTITIGKISPKMDKYIKIHTKISEIVMKKCQSLRNRTTFSIEYQIWSNTRKMEWLFVIQIGKKDLFGGKIDHTHHWVFAIDWVTIVQPLENIK